MGGRGVQPASSPTNKLSPLRKLMNKWCFLSVLLLKATQVTRSNGHPGTVVVAKTDCYKLYQGMQLFVLLPSKIRSMHSFHILFHIPHSAFYTLPIQYEYTGVHALRVTLYECP